MARGHWMTGTTNLYRGWLITSEEIAATGADYVALGHWPQAVPPATAQSPAYYSGSPDLAGTVNFARFTDGHLDVRRAPLASV